MTQYLVDSAQVAQASASVSAVSDRIRADITAMMSQLQALEGSWTGQAATQFSACATRWHATAIQVETALDDISSSLGFASGTYAEAERAASAAFAMG